MGEFHYFVPDFDIRITFASLVLRGIESTRTMSDLSLDLLEPPKTPADGAQRWQRFSSTIELTGGETVRSKEW